MPFNKIKARLALENGTIFSGYGFGAISENSEGEVVFNTSITGYQEILTDPSYTGQIVTMTYPHIGNVGVNQFDVESHKMYASGMIVKEISRIRSNWRSEFSIQEYFETVSYTHLRAHETVLDLVCRLLLEKKKPNDHKLVTDIYLHHCCKEE